MALQAALDAESSSLLIDSKLLDTALIKLRLLKVRANLRNLLEKYPEDELMSIQERLLMVEYNAVRRSDLESTPLAKDLRNSGAKENSPQILDELNSLASDMQLRQRKVDKMEVNRYQQEQLSSDLVDMAKVIKKNAELFQRKLEADSDLVTSTTNAISRTAGYMSNVGEKLSKYRRETQLGWLFYIYSTLFIVFALIFGMTLVQLFGKW